jgi:protoporphyrinogen IX oxidase
MIVNVILFLHLIGLALGVGAGMALSHLGPVLTTATPEQRTTLFTYGKLIRKNAHGGLALLWVTGILMVWLKYDGVAGLSHWFWAKMVLVLVLSAAIGIGSKAFRQFAEGDAEAGKRVKIAGMVNGLSAIGVVLCAVLAFN